MRRSRRLQASFYGLRLPGRLGFLYDFFVRCWFLFFRVNELPMLLKDKGLHKRRYISLYISCGIFINKNIEMQRKTAQMQSTITNASPPLLSHVLRRFSQSGSRSPGILTNSSVAGRRERISLAGQLQLKMLHGEGPPPCLV